MVFKKNWITLIAMFYLFTLLAVLTVSCSHITNPVYSMYIVKYIDNSLGPTKLPIVVKPNPYPDWVQQSFIPGDKLVLYITFSHLEKAITFSRYAFYSRETSQEAETALPSSFGPFGPYPDDGGIRDINGGPWQVPDKPGKYEVRVYLGDKIEGSAVFEVGSPP